MKKFKIKEIVSYIVERLIIALITLVISLLGTGIILLITGSTMMGMIFGGIMLYATIAANIISL